jgi:hypothetical protein
VPAVAAWFSCLKVLGIAFAADGWCCCTTRAVTSRGIYVSWARDAKLGSGWTGVISAGSRREHGGRLAGR